MNLSFSVMKMVITLFCIYNFGLKAEAAQKAKIVSPRVDIYSAADFDSDVLDSVQQGETYFVSDKVFGPFFKIKLKSGKIGYIPDTEVYLEGKGRVVPGASEVDEDPFLQQMDSDPEPPAKKNKNLKKKKEDPAEEDDDFPHGGLTLQLINFHEDTLGAVQVDDLTAIGYKSVDDLAWEVLVSPQAPKYYTNKLNAQVKGFTLWGDFGISNEVPFSKSFSVRYAAGLFSRLTVLNIEASQKTYDLQELTVGPFLEGAFLFKFKKLSYDLSLKYFFDRQSYGGLGFSVFF